MIFSNINKLAAKSLYSRLTIIGLLLLFVQNASSALTCESVFQGQTGSQRNFIIEPGLESEKEIKVTLKKIGSDPADFFINMVEFRKNWAKDHPDRRAGFPFPIMKPVTEMMISALRAKRTKLGVEKNIFTDKVDQFIDRGNSLLLEEVPYDKLALYVSDWSILMTAVDFHLAGNSADALSYVSEIAKPLEQQDIRKSPFRNILNTRNITGVNPLEDLNALFIFVPFELSFISLNKLWVHKIHAIGMRTELTDDDLKQPNIFTKHDFDHYHSSVALGRNLLLYQKQTEIEHAMRVSIQSAVSPENLIRLGLSTNQGKDFEKASEFIIFLEYHENNVPFGGWRPISDDKSLSAFVNSRKEEFSGLEDLYRSGVLKAAAQNLDAFWATHAVRTYNSVATGASSEFKKQDPVSINLISNNY